MMRPELTAHMLVMPLQPEDGEPALALGAIHVDGIVGKPPRQFTQISQNLTRIVLGTKQDFSLQPQTVFGMAEGPSEFTHEKGRPTAAGRPKFKIIDGGRE